MTMDEPPRDEPGEQQRRLIALDAALRRIREQIAKQPRLIALAVDVATGRRRPPE